MSETTPEEVVRPMPVEPIGYRCDWKHEIQHRDEKPDVFPCTNYATVNTQTRHRCAAHESEP